MQTPLPLQVPTSVSTLAAQLAVPHAVLVVAAWHAVESLPLQVEPHVVPAPTPPQLARVPCGSWLGGRVVHVPTLDETSHASHCPAHAVLQQTPSTQLPLPHSPLVVQAVPFNSAQVPLCVRLHAEPAPHEATSQQTPSVQKPLAHWVDAVHAAAAARSATQTWLVLQLKPAAQSDAEAHVVLQEDGAHTKPLHELVGCRHRRGRSSHRHRSRPRARPSA